MSENLSGNNGERESFDPGSVGEPSPTGTPRQSALRRVPGLAVVALAGITAIFLVFHLAGGTSAYIKSQFTGKMGRMGIAFTSDEFRVGIFPITVSIRGGRFNDKLTGEKLIEVGAADLELTMRDVWAMRLRREISIDSTEVRGAKVFVTFDESGRSNFANIKMVEEDDAIKVTFRASRLSIKESELVFNDSARKIAAETKSLSLELSPRDLSVPDERKSYGVELAATDAFLDFGQKRLEGVELRAGGVIRPDGADVESVSVKTPAGTATLRGKIDGWENPRYDFDLESTLDMTRISEVFPIGSPLQGGGSFSGKITGSGSTYRVDGTVESETLTATDVALKGLDITAAIEGRDGAYEANGKAVAQILTFEGFRIDLLRLSGLIRGSGTDFEWVGELQAAAAKTPSGSIGGLFISDAVAEYNERNGYYSDFGKVSAKSYVLDDLFIGDIRASDLVIATGDGTTKISTTGAEASSLKTDTVRLGPIKSGRIDIVDRGPVTGIKTDRLTSTFARIGDFDFRDLKSNNVDITARGGVTDIRADDLSAETVVSQGIDIGRMAATGLDIRDDTKGLVAMSKGLSVAGIRTDSAVIGSINLAGARLSIIQGYVEFTSDDFDTGDIELPKNSVFADGGRLSRVRVARPIYVLERSGRYRASGDLSLGGGVVGSIDIGAAKASVTVTDKGLEVRDLAASVMDGEISGTADVSWDAGSQSNVSLRFKDLDVAKTLAVQGGRMLPVDGHAAGIFEVEFDGTDWKTASGRVDADIVGATGHESDGMVPIEGRIAASGTTGLFQVETANLRTSASVFDAAGSIDLSGRSGKLKLDIASQDAGEIERIIRSFDLSEEIRKRIDEYRVELAGALDFRGEIVGNISEPIIDAYAKVASFTIRGRLLGAFETQLIDSPDAFELRQGRLTEGDGGSLVFDLFVPSSGTDNASLSARLSGIDVGNILSALPVELPRALRELKADTSGLIDLKGLPDAMEGDASLTAENASIGSESFDRLETRARFAGTKITVDSLKALFGSGFAEAVGSYSTDTTEFDLAVTGSGVPLSRLRALSSDPDNLPPFEGTLDLQGRAIGRTSDSTSYDFRFNGSGKDVSVRNSRVGTMEFTGTTANKVLSLQAKLGDGPGVQTIEGTIDFNDPRLGFEAKSVFDKSSLDPYIAFVRDSGEVPITGRATGTLDVRGRLYTADERGELVFNPSELSGRAAFTQFDVQIDQTPLVAVEPVAVSLTNEEIVFEKAALAGGGSNVRISGAKALSGNRENTLSIVGRVNLAILNAFVDDTFFSGFGDVNIRLTGPNETARVNGRADLVSASLSTFISAERVSLERVKGTVIFTSNQVQIQNATGVIGGGNVTIGGGALVNDDFELDSYKLDLRGDNISLPLPKNFLTTGDAVLSVSGRRAGGDFNSFISGRINARRSVFTTNIDLADVIGERRDSPLAQTRPAGGYGNIGLDVIVEGRDALVVRNNLADLTASLSLRVTGNVDTPQVAGRITANSGTLFFRYERYEVRRGELLFPPNTTIEPFINLQAEAEIQGYQVLVNLSGSLSDMDTLSATLRSNPALPQADVISLITTGSLANTQAGIPTTTQSGISTAADILTDEILSKPISKATDRLFGLNRFELDPIISGQRLNPTARLTVGRQINRNLLVTYSTNLAQDQNQVLALEYRLSNRLSFIAQYEQRSIANVTQKSDGFSFEIRLRKRF